MFVHPKEYDVIVVGAGHAGIEAALASARIGCSTLLTTINLDTIGQMSCNPAVGGLAKGHLVREVDAMGGVMGWLSDMTGLQFRMLNTKKGPAVRAPRVQCDKKAYQAAAKWICERQSGLDIIQAEVAAILFKGSAAVGVQTKMASCYRSKAVIVTTGTFLRGLMHIGANQQPGGRLGDTAAMHLSASLKSAGLELGRLKTGTPPRLLKRSMDFSKTEEQRGDDPPPFFTHWLEELFHVEQPGRADAGRADLDTGTRRGPTRFPPGSILMQNGGQLPCHITYTTERTADLVRTNLSRSPLYAGTIEGVGPRYCPSIEDKIVRFADKPRHQVFLEPEGIATDEVYPNGLSTSLPFDIQVELVRSIVGCEEAQIIRPAYAVEYDFVFPTQLDGTLESRACRNLFLAGQINGTSGYEEAAAQGLMAGINAARKVQGKEGVVLRRDQAYIGVLIDDLVTKGTTEPYRMFTSRAEHRLLLRQDNADLRLSAIGHMVGSLNHARLVKVEEKRQAIDAEIQRLHRTRSGGCTLAQLLRRPDVGYEDLPCPNLGLGSDVTEQVEIELKYEGYIQRQEDEIAKARGLECRVIPDEFDYGAVPGLRIEARHKLAKIRPNTVGQATRISGVSPSDISILLVWLKRAGRTESAKESESGV